MTGAHCEGGVTGDGGLSGEPREDSVREVLEDNHGRKHNYLRISLSERCNLRCESISC